MCVLRACVRLCVMAMIQNIPKFAFGVNWLQVQKSVIFINLWPRCGRSSVVKIGEKTSRFAGFVYEMMICFDESMKRPV